MQAIRCMASYFAKRGTSSYIGNAMFFISLQVQCVASSMRAEGTVLNTIILPPINLVNLIEKGVFV